MNYTEMLFNRDERLIRMLNDADNKNLELIVEINKQEEELDKYKNIVDELENFILNHYIVGHKVQNASLDDILNKLKELKGE